MNKLLLVMVLTLAVGAMFAQSSIGKSETQLNAGVGLSSWGVPVYIGLDYGVSRDFSLGGEFSYHSYDEDHHNHKYHHSIIGISGNGNYHFSRILEIPRRWDIYAGLNLGFYVWTSPDEYAGDHTSGLGLGAQVGVRYYFTDSVGINLELGGGNAFSGGKLGLSVKL